MTSTNTNDSVENSQEPQKTYRTRLLSDDPADYDAFGSHKTIAQAIANLICEEDGGKATALIGSWGSGKSTVIRLLKSVLHKSNDRNPDQIVEVFIFDAWAHERDPLRRSFLEKLIDFLCSDRVRWTQKENWEETKQVLSKRLKVTETKRVPKLTWGGLALTLSALAVPIGLALLSAMDVKHPITITMAAIIAVLPLSIAFGILKWDKKAKKLIEKKDVFSIILHRSETTERSEAYETPDPTSIEFQDSFAKLLTSVLQESDRRLVIIIDNLDRVNTRDALSIWSYMQTFFELCNVPECPQWMNRVWFLVPFAPSTPRRMWQFDSDETDTNDIVKGNAHALSDAFLQKTFQAVFHVPPPVLSDWKTFLIENLRKAFPDHEKEEDFYNIFRLFRSKGITEETPITPREIKLFINRIGTIYRIWQQEISLPLQALYVLFIKNNDFNINILRNFVDTSIENIVGREIAPYLAAVHYNVEVDKALQTWIGEDVRKALIEGNEDKIAEFDSKGLTDLCEQIIEEDYEHWIAREPESLALSTLAIDSLASISPDKWEPPKRLLLEGILRVTDWVNLDEEVANGIVLMLRSLKDSDYRNAAEKITRGITLPYLEDEPDIEADRETLKAWLDGSLIIIEELKGAGFEDIIRRVFRVPFGVSSYINTLLILSKQSIPDEFTKYYKSRITPTEIVSRLSTICEEGKFTQPYNNVVDLMHKTRTDWSWEIFAKALNQRLQGSNKLESLELLGCTSAILSLAFDVAPPIAKPYLKDLCISGHLMHHLHNVMPLNIPKAVGYCLFPIIQINPGGKVRSHIGQSQQGENTYTTIINDPSQHPEIVDTLLELTIRFGTMVQLMSSAIETPIISQLVNILLELIAERDDIENHVTDEIIIEHSPYLEEDLSAETFKNIILQLTAKSSFIETLTTQEFSFELKKLYCTVIKYINDFPQQQQQLAEYLIKNIRNISEEQWLDILTEEDEVLDIVTILVSNGFTIDLSTSFHDALLEHVKDVHSEASIVEKLRADWKTIIGALSGHSEYTLHQYIRDFIISESESSIKSILELYGESLITSNVLKEKEKVEDMIRYLFVEIIKREDQEELAWLSLVIKSHSDIFDICSKPTLESFRDRVRDLLSDDELEADSVNYVNEIARIVKVRRRRKSKQPEDI